MEAPTEVTPDHGNPEQESDPEDNTNLTEGQQVPAAGESPTPPDHDRTRTSSLLEVARRISEQKPQERQLLTDRLEAFGDLKDEQARREASQEIFTVAANIVGRAITEQSHQTELLNALANSNLDLNRTAPSPEDMDEWHRDITQTLKQLTKISDLPSEVLAKIGEEMVIEFLFPRAHVIIPPTDPVGAVFTAMTLLKMARGGH
ncbi:hypothetical protein C6W10_31325 [Plantactinospora sp. BB1]|nr:hypothetical protein C6W10_31325 [Plantactinospora sp. BB1]